MVPTLPQVGFATLLPLPSRLCTSKPSAAFALGMTAMTVPTAASIATEAMATAVRRLLSSRPGRRRTAMFNARVIIWGWRCMFPPGADAVSLLRGCFVGTGVHECQRPPYSGRPEGDGGWRCAGKGDFPLHGALAPSRGRDRHSHYA